MSEERNIMKVPLNQIEDNSELNCRGTISAIDVVQLAKDIKTNGLVQPVIIRTIRPDDPVESDKPFMLVCGFRRFKAHQVGQMETVDAILTECDYRKSRILNLSENIQRRELDILMEANAVAKLLKQGYTEKEIGEELNMSYGWVQVRKMLLTMPEEIKKEAAARTINQAQIRELYSLPDDASKFEAVRKIKDAKATGKKLTKEDIRPKAKCKQIKRTRTAKEMQEFMEHVMDHIGAGFATRCLAWASGEISSEEIERDLSMQCDAKGIAYTPFEG